MTTLPIVAIVLARSCCFCWWLPNVRWWTRKHSGGSLSALSHVTSRVWERFVTVKNYRLHCNHLVQNAVIPGNIWPWRRSGSSAMRGLWVGFGFKRASIENINPKISTCLWWLRSCLVVTRFLSVVIGRFMAQWLSRKCHPNRIALRLKIWLMSRPPFFLFFLRFTESHLITNPTGIWPD